MVDSSAFLNIKRLLPQHQSAITLINTRLQNPSQKNLSWLDLACGKGQIISQLSDNISPNNRKKIKYTGYDINPNYTRIAEKIACNLEFNSYVFTHGDMSNFSKIIQLDNFDFITCTNTVHELMPKVFANLLIDSLIKLSDAGELFIYDMESLEKPELGALPWRGREINELINILLEVAGTNYRVHPNIWNHSTCKGWTVVIQKQYLNISNKNLTNNRDEITTCLDETIEKLLDERLRECEKILKAYQRFGVETAEEEKLKELSLYEFWALHNAKELYR